MVPRQCAESMPDFVNDSGDADADVEHSGTHWDAEAEALVALGPRWGGQGFLVAQYRHWWWTHITSLSLAAGILLAASWRHIAIPEALAETPRQRRATRGSRKRQTAQSPDYEHRARVRRLNVSVVKSKPFYLMYVAKFDPDKHAPILEPNPTHLHISCRKWKWLLSCWDKKLKHFFEEYYGAEVCGP